MIDKQKIIISYYREGKTQRQIARETGINRKTIRRYLAQYEKNKNILIGSKGGDNSELIADIVEKPKYDTSSRYKVKLTDEIISRIGFYLKQNEEKRATGRSKQQKKKIDILEALTVIVADDPVRIDLYKDKLSYKAVWNRVVAAIYRNGRV
ncbi:unnamed protein product, partial [marine sediment metagenome]